MQAALPALRILFLDRSLLLVLHQQEETRLKRFFSRRLRRPDDVQDATQETFLRMLTVPKSTLIDNPQAYLFQVAKSVASASYARQARERELFVDEEAGWSAADDSPGQERILNGQQGLVLMARAISKLPNRCQQVFILSRLHGMANGEIAQELSISRNMVEKHIIKALLHCRKIKAEIFF